MSIRTHNGQWLIAGAGIATNNDCCCDEPCCPTTLRVDFASGQDAFFPVLRNCDPQVGETLTITFPDCVPLPFDATVTWDVDDDVEVDGQRMNDPQPGCASFLATLPGNPIGTDDPPCCSGSGTKVKTFNTRTITCKLIDTVGGYFRGYVSIAFECNPLP